MFRMLRKFQWHFDQVYHTDFRSFGAQKMSTWSSLKYKLCLRDFALYRVVKQNCQVVKIVNFGHMNEFGVQNSSPTCEHNLFTLIQSKKMFVKYLVMLQSSKKLKGGRFELWPLQRLHWGWAIFFWLDLTQKLF